jgi:polyphosphate kinase
MQLSKFQNDESICSFTVYLNKQYVILIDDVIRHNLKVFLIFSSNESVSAHMIKISRDAQLDIDSDLSKSMLEKFLRVKDRLIGASCFIYDQ